MSPASMVNYIRNFPVCNGVLSNPTPFVSTAQQPLPSLAFLAFQEPERQIGAGADKGKRIFGRIPCFGRICRQTGSDKIICSGYNELPAGPPKRKPAISKTVGFFMRAAQYTVSCKGFILILLNSALSILFPGFTLLARQSYVPRISIGTFCPVSARVNKARNIPS